MLYHLSIDNLIWGISSVGRAPALHAGGQEFEPPILQNLIKEPLRLFLCIKKRKKVTSLQKTFKEFYSPDYETLWNSCIFVFDTNVLLNLYRYGEETKNAFLKVLEKIGNKKWIPYQVGYEYHKNRLEVIHEIKNNSQKTKDDVEKSAKNIQDVFSIIKKQNSFSNKDETTLDNCIANIKKLVAKYSKKSEEKFNNLKDNDSIQEQLVRLFDSKIGKNYTSENLALLYKKAQERFEKKIPPGFCDDKKSGNDKYSDFIVWQQILDYAKEKTTSIIFVTADEKEDWWHICKGEKRCSPTLKKEFFDHVKKDFHMYTPEQFINEAKNFYNLNYSDEIIEEVKQTKRYSSTHGLYSNPYNVGWQYYAFREMLLNFETVSDFVDFLINQYSSYISAYMVRQLIDLKTQYRYSKEIPTKVLIRLSRIFELIEARKEQKPVQGNLFNIDNSEDKDE